MPAGGRAGIGFRLLRVVAEPVVAAVAAVALIAVPAAPVARAAGSPSPPPPPPTSGAASATRPSGPPRQRLASTSHVPGPKVSVVLTTADLRQALARQAPVRFAAGIATRGSVITVDPRSRYQRIKAVGAAMTDSSAFLIQTGLPAPTRTWLMGRLFGPGGLHLGLLRVPMGASDFSAQGVPYTYDDMPAGQTDPTLANFSIDHDRAYILPALREALGENPQARVFASPWSPPAWMKSGDTLGNPGNAISTLAPSAYAPLARYFVRFVQAYRAAGVPIWAVTPQNEPGQYTGYPGMNLDEAGEAAFITQNLAPALHSARLRTRIYGYDNNWYGDGMGYAYALALGSAARDLAGIASHCYFGNAGALAGLHRVAPRLDEVVSECAMGSGLAFNPSQIEIAATRNWASAVTLWNLALDPTGGPVQPPNAGCHGCTGVVTVDPKAGTVRLNRDYYQLGQFSKYVAPGAVRIGSNTLVRDQYSYPSGLITTSGVDDVAFQNPDGSRVLLAYANTTTPMSFTVTDGGKSFHYRLAPGATATFTWTPGR